MSAKRSPVLLLLLLLLAGPWAASAADYFVATTGTPTASGTIGNPWNLQRALNGTAPIVPGDTIWVRGGVYLGPFTSYLKGTSAQPIVVRNYDNERVLLDSQYAQCNPSKCPPSQWQAQNPWLPACVPDGNGNVVQGANYQCNSFAARCSLDPATNPSASHFSLARYALDIQECSHDVWFWGLEMLSAENGGRISIPPGCSASNPAPGCCWVNGVMQPECESTNDIVARSYGGAIDINGDNIRVINCFLHDGGVNISWFNQSENSEVYGSFSFNGGWSSALRGHGHGTYTQNIDCTDRPSQKAFRETVFFHAFDLGAMAFSGGCGPVQNYLYEGVVTFNNAAPHNAFLANADHAVFPTWLNGHGYGEAVYLGSRLGTRATLRNVYTFNNELEDPMRYSTAIRVDGAGRPVSELSVENSVFTGTYSPVALYDIAMLRFVGNKVVAGVLPDDPPYGVISFYAPGEHMTAHFPNYLIDQNSYYRYAGPVKMAVRNSTASTDTAVPFATWQSSYGWDQGGTAATGLPTTNWVYVRPNAYEAGRAHVVVYNWEDMASVSADLSNIGLNDGQAFKVYNVQSFKSDLDVNNPDYYGNVVGSGTFSASSPTVSIAMKNPVDAVATSPIGAPYTVPSSLPRFGLFLVLGQ